MSLHEIAHRHFLPEQMDAPQLDPAEHLRALTGLRRLNKAGAAAAHLWRRLREVARNRQRPLRILDLACGGGDVALDLWRTAHRDQVRLEIVGWDFSPTAVDVARSRAEQISSGLQFETHDVREAFPRDFDVVMTSLFLHHLPTEDAVELLNRMATATRRMILVSDLIRSRSSYALVWGASRLLTTSSMVRHDGPQSVANAFSLSEADALFTRAGIHGVDLRRHWPCRWIASWMKP